MIPTTTGEFPAHSNLHNSFYPCRSDRRGFGDGKTLRCPFRLCRNPVIVQGVFSSGPVPGMKGNDATVLHNKNLIFIEVYFSCRLPSTSSRATNRKHQTKLPDDGHPPSYGKDSIIYRDLNCLIVGSCGSRISRSETWRRDPVPSVLLTNKCSFRITLSIFPTGKLVQMLSRKRELFLIMLSNKCGRVHRLKSAWCIYPDCIAADVLLCYQRSTGFVGDNQDEGCARKVGCLMSARMLLSFLNAVDEPRSTDCVKIHDLYYCCFQPIFGPIHTSKRLSLDTGKCAFTIHKSNMLLQIW